MERREAAEDPRNLTDELKGLPNEEIFARLEERRNELEVAIENNCERVGPLSEKQFVPQTTLIFGSEGDGLSGEVLAEVDDVREIESFGSTRSVNVGVAAGIAMYEWARQCLLGNRDD